MGIVLNACLFVILMSGVGEAAGIDPKHYKVEFENSQVRVVRVFFGSHYKSVINETPPRVPENLSDQPFELI